MGHHNIAVSIWGTVLMLIHGNNMSKNIDGGWAWVILTCGFCSFILNGFLCYSMGIITEAMLEVFEEDLSLTSAVGSAVIGAQCCTGPLAGLLSERFGCRACAIVGGIIATVGLVGASVSKDLSTVLVVGVITGVGFGLPLISCNVITGFYFNRLRPLAAGIAMTGAGLGMFVGPPLVRYLIDQYSLHGAFLIMGGISSHFCVIGSLLKPLQRPDVSRNLTDRQKKCSCWSKTVFRRLCEKKIKCGVRPSEKRKTLRFMTYLFSVFLFSVGDSACFLHLPNYCIQQGSSKQDTALLFSAMGVGNIVSRLLTGFAANDENVNSISLHVGQLGVAGIVTGLFPYYSKTYRGQMLYSIALGIYSSGVNSLLTPIVVQLIGLDHLPVGFGLVQCFVGLGYLTGSPVAGVIVDYGATYRESFFMAGSVYLLASLSAMTIPLFHPMSDDHVICRLRPLENIINRLEAAHDGGDELDTIYISDNHQEKTNNTDCEL